MKTIFTMILLFACSFFNETVAQDHVQSHTNNHHHKGFRLVGLIGHTLINSEGSNSYIFVPSWGLDIEYWVSPHWGLGMHNDIEIESFIIQSEDRTEVERVNPLVLTIDGLYRFDNGFVVAMGPGVEIENSESHLLGRIGIEYEKTISGGLDISPSIFYDQRFDGYATYTFALGIGKSF